MERKYNSFILLFLLCLFILVFKYNPLIRDTVIYSCDLWFNNLVPFMFVTYLLVDLLLNYGIGDIFYRVFKSNVPILFIISMLLGTPANAKYVSEFYKNGYISEDSANWLLLFAYSPNPLFVFGIVPKYEMGVVVLLVLYLTNFLIAFFSIKYIRMNKCNQKKFENKSFTKCIEESIYKSSKILLLILGIIIIYAIIIKFMDLFFPENFFILKIILEITNGINIIVNSNPDMYKWILFAVSFGGLSIHTQVKSILSDTNLSYSHFLLGRLIASLISLLIIIVL